MLPVIFGLTLGMLMIPLIENKIVYHPYKYPEGNWHPESYSLQPEDCYFSTMDNIKLHGWFFRAESARATLLWCHGNAGNITHRLDNIKRLQPFSINIFIFDYRGYGRSEGEPSEDGIYQDALAAYEYLLSHPEVDPKNILLFGRSLGATVAVDLATKKPSRGIILESAFTSAKDVAKEMNRWLPLHFVIRSKFDSITKIKQIHSPMLFIHGNDDEIIPITLGKKLFEAANEPKWFYEISGAGHNDTYVVGGSRYFQQLDEFIQKIMGSK